MNIEAYKEALEAVAAIIPDFVASAVAADAPPYSPERKEYENKAAFVFAMSDAIKSLNGMRHNVLVTNKPLPRLPRNEYPTQHHNPRPNPTYNSFPRRFDGDDNY